MLNRITTATIDTPVGSMLVGATDKGVCLCDFNDRSYFDAICERIERSMSASLTEGSHKFIDLLSRQLDEYFARSRQIFEIPLTWSGTPFQRQVWVQLCQIPFGETRTYKEQAISMDKPQAIRAIARANGANCLAIIVPCHRVIGGKGALKGYSGGLERKSWLLNFESGQDLHKIQLSLFL